ncbi:MAG: hypothetical protein WD696_01550 [Bryobacteraceae bacterium]
MNQKCIAVLPVLALVLSAADERSGDFKKLFNGKNLEGFDTVLREKGVNRDPQTVFRVEKGTIRVSGVEYGYFVT